MTQSVADVPAEHTAGLLPCPFCGGDAALTGTNMYRAGKQKKLAVCRDCGACASDDLWNTRTASRAMSNPSCPFDRLAIAKAIASKTYAFANMPEEGSDQYDCGDWEEMGELAHATYLDAADAVIAIIIGDHP